MYDQLRDEYESVKRSSIQPKHFFSRTEPYLFANNADMMDNRDHMRKGNPIVFRIIAWNYRGWCSLDVLFIVYEYSLSKFLYIYKMHFAQYLNADSQNSLDFGYYETALTF